MFGVGVFLKNEVCDVELAVAFLVAAELPVGTLCWTGFE
jgi:hypothetical protein